MSFLNSEFLIFMLPPFFVFAFFIIRNSNSLKKYFDETILQKIIIKGDKLGTQGRSISLLLALFFMIIALSRPVSDIKELTVDNPTSNLIIALDISKSMLVKDVYPNRLEFAKNRISWLINALPHTDIGLIAFAKDAFLVSPVTSDKQSLSFLLNNLSEDAVSRQGTNITNALKQADALFHNERQKKVLLISDGGDSQDIQKAVLVAQDKKLHVSVMVIGTKKGGVIQDDEGLVKDKKGNIVISKRNDSLIELSKKTNGIFIQEFGEGRGVKLLKNALEKDQKKSSKDKKVIMSKKELFIIPLLLALLFILIAFHGFASKKSAHIVTIMFFLTCNNVMYGGVFDFYHLHKANNALEEKKYDKALEEYNVLKENDSIKYNKGNIYYKKGDYDKAIKIYQSIKTENKNLSFKSLFNQGNSYVKKKEYKNALSSYENALKLKPKDKDTLSNIDYVKKRMQKQKQQENKNSQNNKNNQKNQKKDSQKKNDNSKDKQKNQNKKQNNKDNKASQDKKNKQNNKEKQKNKAQQKSSQQKKDNQNQNFSMSEQEAKKWEKKLTKYKPKTRPIILGDEQKNTGDTTDNAW